MKANDSLRHFRLQVAKMPHESFEAAMLGQHLFTNLVEFLDDRIFSHCHGSMSSEGVQINGGSNPEARHRIHLRGKPSGASLCTVLLSRLLREEGGEVFLIQCGRQIAHLARERSRDTHDRDQTRQHRACLDCADVTLPHSGPFGESDLRDVALFSQYA
jgi:hypothetical protein